MASSNDLDSFPALRNQIQPLQSSSLADLWNPDQTHILPKSLIESFYGRNNNHAVHDPDSCFFQLLSPDQPHNSSDLSKLDYCPAAVTSTTCSLSASEPEISTTPSKGLTAKKGRITKRKSRATKKNQTTFITADPANFRQMVQQVTGIRFDNSSSQQLLLKPEPLRPPVPRLYYSSCLPTLDTSSFLLDRQMQGQTLANNDGRSTYSTVAYGGGEDRAGGGYGASFPTLESWKVM